MFTLPPPTNLTLVDVPDAGFVSLLGKEIEIFESTYIYAGVLIGVNDTFLKLGNPHIIYETGSFSDSRNKDAQPLNREWHCIQINAISSWGPCSKLGILKK